MNILYIGDVMGAPGIEAVRLTLPTLKKEYDIDLVIAQAENVTEGKGVSKEDFKFLQDIGINFCTGGNWSLHRPEINDYLSDPQQPIIRPANYPIQVPGKGWKYVQTKKGRVLIISLLGQIVGKDAEKETDNPLLTIDTILEQNKNEEKVATLVNFHGDYSSEKRVIGYYLDGRVSAIIGDHWHIQTADAMILPNNSAHITDVGMCGTIHSSLGVKLIVIIDRWRDNRINRNELELNGPLQFNAVLIDVDENTQLSRSIQSIHKIIDR